MFVLIQNVFLPFPYPVLRLRSPLVIKERLDLIRPSGCFTFPTSTIAFSVGSSLTFLPPRTPILCVSVRAPEEYYLRPKIKSNDLGGDFQRVVVQFLLRLYTVSCIILSTFLRSSLKLDCSFLPSTVVLCLVVFGGKSKDNFAIDAASKQGQLTTATSYHLPYNLY